MILDNLSLLLSSSTSMDPLSVAASIIGILGAATKIVELLQPVVSTLTESTKNAAIVCSRVENARNVLSALQKLLNNLSATPRNRKDLIPLDHLIVALTNGVLLFSELEATILQLGTSTENMRTRIQWARKDKTLGVMLSRLQGFEISISVMLNILQCESDMEAAISQKELYESNVEISQRLANLENALLLKNDTDVNIKPSTNRRSSIVSGTLITQFDFQSDLEESRPYRKALRPSADFSFRSSVVPSHAWSALSDISLSEISVIAVIALPISPHDITNGHHYQLQEAKVQVLEEEQVANLSEPELESTPPWLSIVTASRALMSDTLLPPLLLENRALLRLPLEDPESFEAPITPPGQDIADTFDIRALEPSKLSNVGEPGSSYPHSGLDIAGNVYARALLSSPSADPTGSNDHTTVSDDERYLNTRPAPKPTVIDTNPISKFLREYKIVVIGAGGVGKTALIIQLVQSHFVDEYEPTIEEQYHKRLEVDDQLVLLSILDTGGQEEFSALREQYIRTGRGFLLVYSITDRQGFEEITELRMVIHRVKQKGHYSIILIGNKSDMAGERQVSRQEGEHLSRHFGCPFMEVSSKTRVNVDLAFHDLVRALRQYEKKMRVKGSSIGSIKQVPDEPVVRTSKLRKRWLGRKKSDDSRLEAVEE